jgi:hypothetical protein
MTAKKKVTTKSARNGKAEGSDEVTAERVRAFLENPDAKESAKGSVRKLIGELYGALDCDTLPETPDYYGLLFEQTQTTYHRHATNGTLEDAEREICAKLAEAVNRHEPKDARLVRRLSAVLGDPKTDGQDTQPHRLHHVRSLERDAHGRPALGNISGARPPLLQGFAQGDQGRVAHGAAAEKPPARA